VRKITEINNTQATVTVQKPNLYTIQKTIFVVLKGFIFYQNNYKTRYLFKFEKHKNKGFIKNINFFCINNISEKYYNIANTVN